MHVESGFRRRLYWVGIALVLTVAAALALYREVGAGAVRGKDQVERFDDVVAGRLPDPLSLKGVQTNLIDCMEMADGLYARLQPEEQVISIAAKCSEEAAAVFKNYPSYGLAALVSARMAAIVEDWTRFNEMLRRSQTGARAEQWISVERLRLYVQYSQHLEPQTLEARTADVRLLLMSPIGIRSIASTYLENEDLRALIASEAELMPDAVQRRFVSVVRAVLRTRGGS